MSFLVTFPDTLLWVLHRHHRALAALLVRPGRPHAIARILIDITEPVRPIRRVMPQTGMVDFAPLVALLVIFLLQTILRNVVVR